MIEVTLRVEECNGMGQTVAETAVNPATTYQNTGTANCYAVSEGSSAPQYLIESSNQ